MKPITMLLAGSALLALILSWPAASGEAMATLPDPVLDAPLVKTPGRQTAVFAGGCFWGVQAVFQHLNGVISATSGYAGGGAASARYDQVSGGRSGHAEAVSVVYDPARTSYGQLLKVFFAVAHDPTQLNSQGPDSGSQYRSAIFAANAEQQRLARAYVKQLEQGKVFAAPIVTQINAPDSYTFYAAEDYHQDYLKKHPEQSYIVINDLPKLAQLKRQFPTQYRD